jgi:hypothetical protein
MKKRERIKSNLLLLSYYLVLLLTRWWWWPVWHEPGRETGARALRVSLCLHHGRLPLVVVAAVGAEQQLLRLLLAERKRTLLQCHRCCCARTAVSSMRGYNKCQDYSGVIFVDQVSQEQGNKECWQQTLFRDRRLDRSFRSFPYELILMKRGIIARKRLRSIWDQTSPPS